MKKGNKEDLPLLLQSSSLFRRNDLINGIFLILVIIRIVTAGSSLSPFLSLPLPLSLTSMFAQKGFFKKIIIFFVTLEG